MKRLKTGLAAFFAVVASLVIMAGQAEAQTAAEVDGVWRGETSGNETRMTLRPGGDLEARAVTSNIQSAFQLFPRTGPYEWRSNTPGASAVIQLQGGTLIVTQPGFNDTFRRISAPR